MIGIQKSSVSFAPARTPARSVKRVIARAQQEQHSPINRRWYSLPLAGEPRSGCLVPAWNVEDSTLVAHSTGTRFRMLLHALPRHAEHASKFKSIDAEDERLSVMKSLCCQVAASFSSSKLWGADLCLLLPVSSRMSTRRAAAGVLLGLPAALFAAPAFADLLTGIPGDPEPEKFKPGDSPAKERRAALDATAKEIKASGDFHFSALASCSQSACLVDKSFHCMSACWGSTIPQRGFARSQDMPSKFLSMLRRQGQGRVRGEREVCGRRALPNSR